jgi:hypothetical protein
VGVNVTPAAFKRSLAQAVPPKALSAALHGLWWAGKGDWDKAHRAVMDEPSREAALPICTGARRGRRRQRRLLVPQGAAKARNRADRGRMAGNRPHFAPGTRPLTTLWPMERVNHSW